jgi:hypothetical protein
VEHSKVSENYLIASIQSRVYLKSCVFFIEKISKNFTAPFPSEPPLSRACIPNKTGKIRINETGERVWDP